nr:DNA helicase [Tanacetum cinerariifolium]
MTLNLAKVSKGMESSSLQRLRIVVEGTIRGRIICYKTIRWVWKIVLRILRLPPPKVWVTSPRWVISVTKIVLLRSNVSFQQAFDLIFELDETTIGCIHDILRQRDCLDRFCKVSWSFQLCCNRGRGNILNHVQTFTTFDALDNVLSGYGPGCDVPSVGAHLASCCSQITGLYLDVFRKCSDVCVINHAEDAQLYLNVYRKYSQVSGKVPCVQQGIILRGSSAFVRGEGDCLDKRKLQLSDNSDITPVFNSNLVHTDFNYVCGPSVSLPCRIFHANPNAVMITDGGNTQENCQLGSTIGVSNNGCSTSRRVRNVKVRPHLNSVVGVRSTSRRTSHLVLTSGATVDNNSVASGGTSYAYSDLGDCDRRCCYCGASFWYVEHLKGHPHNQAPEYHLCCGGGRIQMQPPREPPEYIKSLFQNKHFMENIWAFNQMFAMTSFGEKIDESINIGRGSYVFKVSGQIYHWIGSLCPPVREPPSQLEHGIVEGLIHFLDAHNELVQLLRTTRDKCKELDIPEFKIRLYNAKCARGYELPTSNTLGAMVFERGISDNADFDVIIQHRDGPPQRPGYYTELTLKSDNGGGRGKRVTMLAYYRYQLHFRLQQYDLLFRGGRLFQQYVIGVSCVVEQNRLDYIRKKQNDIRSDYLSGLYDAISRGERDAYEVGGRIILPTSFTSEIKRFMSEYPHLTASDRADVVCRVFEQKIQALIVFLKEERIFGDVTGAFRAHINVEYCGRGMLIKYLFKYISKGTDRVFARVSRRIGESSTTATPSRQVIDEIQNYVEGRFVCDHEAYWRILKFEIHRREPAVQILAVHLEDMQRITFRDQDKLESAIDLPGKKNTTLTEWFAFNEANEVGRNLTYLEFPSEFMWYSDKKSWSPQKYSKSSIGRLAAACQALGLLGDEKE